MNHVVAPHFTKDRRWWWDGNAWVPVPAAPVAAPPTSDSPTPQRMSNSGQMARPGFRLATSERFGDEQELLCKGIHPLKSEYVFTVIPVAIILLGLVAHSLYIVIFGFTVLASIVLLARLKIANTKITVTTRRVILTRGILMKHDDAVLLEKVESVSVRQGVMGRQWGYGAISVTGTGGSGRFFDGVRDPQLIRDAVNGQVARMSSR